MVILTSGLTPMNIFEIKEIKKRIKFVLFGFGFDIQKSSENLKFEFLEIIFSAYNFPN